MHGQKTYNGVAIPGAPPLTEIERGFGDGGDEAQARLVSARVGGFASCRSTSRTARSRLGEVGLQARMVPACAPGSIIAPPPTSLS
jgi:hypothetical protein